MDSRQQAAGGRKTEKQKTNERQQTQKESKVIRIGIRNDEKRQDRNTFGAFLCHFVTFLFC